MTSAERIREHVKHLRQRIDRLRALQAVALEDYAADFDKRDLIHHNFRVAVESCSDIALMLAARLGLPEPSHRRDVFEALADVGRLSRDLAQKLAGLTSMRNVLVHQYLTIDPALMLQSLRDDVKYFEEFAATAVGWADELEQTNQTKS